MPLGPPAIDGPVSTCTNSVRVLGQFSGARVRIFVEGNPQPVGDSVVGWADATVAVDRSRLVGNRKLVATQQVGAEMSEPSPKGQTIEPAINAKVSTPDTVFTCAQSLYVTGCSAGARLEAWQSGVLLGLADAVGGEAWITFATGERVSPGTVLDVRQFICTSPTPVHSPTAMPSPPPRDDRGRLASPTIEEPLERCQRVVTITDIVMGAVVRLTRRGQLVYEASVPTPNVPVLVDALGDLEELTVTQSLPGCEVQAGEPNVAIVKPLTALKRPRVDGPLCGGPQQVNISRLKGGATLRVFANGKELGRWQAGATTMPVDISIPTPATLTASQELCGIVSPMSRPYEAASDRSGRWAVVEDANGDDLKAHSFAIHAALARTGEIVMFSGDQHNSAQNTATPQDIDHCELFDCDAQAVQKIDAPHSDVFCSGHALRPDGRLVVAGGTQRFPAEGHHASHFPGLKNTWVFSPAPNADGHHWSEAAPMGRGRWYPTLLTLPDGRVLALSGHPEEADPLHNNDSLETFGPSGWTHLGDSPEIDTQISRYLYPRVFVGPTGAVFSATPLAKEFPQDPGRSGEWNPAGGVSWTRSAGPLGNNWGEYDGYRTPAVLLPLLEDEDDQQSFRFRVVLAGEPTPWITDLGTPKAPVVHPRWEPLGNRTRRLNSTLVLLPSGEVFLSGGVGDPGDDNTAVETPEMLVFDGAAWRWDNATLAPAAIPRNYHSTALLMPDGRVFTGGSNINASPGGESVRRLELEIYSPWYVCADRPRILAAPTSVRSGERLLVDAVSSQAISRLALVRAGSSTHGFDHDQRYVGLIARQLGPATYAGVVPVASVAVPGYYLLFACTERSVPSTGVFVRVDSSG